MLAGLPSKAPSSCGRDVRSCPGRTSVSPLRLNLIAMVQMRTVLPVADNSGAKLVRCITVVRRMRKRPSGNVGSELVVSVIENDRSVKQRKARKGELHRALIVRTPNEKLRPDGGSVRASESAAILIARDSGAPLGTRIRGPVSAALDRRRYLKVLSLARTTLFSSLGTRRGMSTSSQGIYFRACPAK
jgi:large subunit ribosomal protein L14